MTKLFKISLLALLTSFFLVGCGSNSSSSSTSSTDVTVVDGYITEATVTDASGKVATLKDGTKGLYTFTGNIQYPITATGGKFYDTNAVFDINMTSQSGTVISPLTTIIGTDTNIKNNLLTLTSASEAEIDGDYINDNNTNLTKLAQLAYVMLKDTTSTATFKTAIGTGFDINTTTNVDALLDNSISNIAKNDSIQSFLESVKNFSGDVKDIEKNLETVKSSIDINSTTLTIVPTVPTSSLSGNIKLENTFEMTLKTLDGKNENSNGEFLFTKSPIILKNKNQDKTKNYDAIKNSLNNNDYFNLKLAVTEDAMTTTSRSTLVSSIIIHDGNNHISLSIRSYFQRSFLGDVTVETQNAAKLAISALINGTEINNLSFSIASEGGGQGGLSGHLISKYPSKNDTHIKYHLFDMIDKFSSDTTYGNTIKEYMSELLTKTGTYDMYIIETDYNGPQVNKVLNTTTLASLPTAVKNSLINSIKETSGNTLSNPDLTTAYKIKVTVE